ncbi:heterokaryon incompatibility protein-domain-containing protein [Paraphoma chrysanthemicola]|uniref:Heterokaryon incompatibility protein-domain-containing protein n=1 Tax=Paraphoma chrysanthemicola TaxID=798071 RepID=A0A8K0RC13_9PLEO|nr:heterokaryon incompatibility protein-domain-containing protein [Paraphoma chrysanthemicola]
MDYRSLDFGRFETRFLRRAALIGDEPEQLLRFDIEIGSITSPPEFQALSYCWGKELGKAEIWVSGTKIPVSTNLEAALRFSDLAVGTCIWVDAICINQHDLYEKSYQLKMMGQIYSKARRVITWLGVEAPYSYAAAGLVNKITRRCMVEQVDSGQDDSKSLEIHRIFDKFLARQHSPPKTLEGLTELFSRPYWERVWIIQEVAKASVVVARCGKLVMDLHILLRLTTYCRHLPDRTQTLLAAISRFRAQELRNHGRMSLVQAMITSRFSVSTDERDKIYALLGLAGDSENLVPLPTYAKSAPEVFEELTRNLIESHQPSNVLALAQRGPLTERVSSAPPWCVDWAQLEVSIPDWVAESSFPANRSQPQRPVFINSILHVQGHEIGRITSHECDSTRMPSDRSIDEFLNKAKSFRVIKDLAFDIINRLSSSTNLSHTSASEEDLVYALSRMIRDENKGVASADYNLFRVGPILNRLGELKINYTHIVEWARRANYERSKRLANAPKTAEHVEQEPLQMSTTWVGSGFGHVLQTTSPALDSQANGPILPSTAGSEITSHTYKIWENILADFSTMAEMQLQFAVLSDRHLVLVPRAARKSWVYTLSNCTLPAVLHKGWDGDFRFLGEVYIMREKDGSGGWANPMALDDTHVVQDERIRINLGREGQPSRRFTYAIGAVRDIGENSD